MGEDTAKTMTGLNSGGSTGAPAWTSKVAGDKEKALIVSEKL